MSEILDQSSVRSVRRVQTTRPSVTLADVLSACCVAIAGGVSLAIDAGRGTARAIQASEARKREQALQSADSALAKAVQDATSARATLGLLGQSTLHLHEPAKIELKVRDLQKALACEPDGRNALELARAICNDALAQHTTVLARASFEKAVAAAEDVGLRVAKALPERGYLLAVGSAGEALRVDVKADPHTGTVSVIRDTDGFQGDACRKFHDRFTEALGKQGVELTSPRRTPKPRTRRVHVAQLHHA